MSVIDTLIFDRTQNDVENKTKKGHYNSDDLNRIFEAVTYLDEIFQEYGYNTGVDRQLANWTAQKIPEYGQLQTCLGNIISLRSILDTLPSTPECPATMDRISYSDANNIEKILSDLGDTLQRLAQSAVACGSSTCGGDYL